MPDQDLDPVISTNCYPTDFVKKYILIKTNSLASRGTPLTLPFLELLKGLVELYNNGNLNSIGICEY